MDIFKIIKSSDLNILKNECLTLSRLEIFQGSIRDLVKFSFVSDLDKDLDSMLSSGGGCGSREVLPGSLVISQPD